MHILNKLVLLENKATQFGFKWDNDEQIMAQIRSEISEIQTHLRDCETNKLQEEIGDLLHAIFSLCVFRQLDPFETLKNSVDKFERRFNAVKKISHSQGLNTLNGKSFNELMMIWNKAKQLVG